MADQSKELPGVDPALRAEPVNPERCSNCGYDTAGLAPGARCPECGRPLGDVRGVITLPVVCQACEYDLRGLAVGDVCPECGGEITDAIERQLALRPARHIKRLRRGALLALFGAVAPILSLIIAAILSAAVFALSRSSGFTAFAGVILLVLYLAPFVLLPLGWFFVSSSCAGLSGSVAPRAQGSLRASTAIFAGLFLTFVGGTVLVTIDALPDELYFVLALGVTGAWVFMHFSSMFYTRALAPTIPNHKLHQRATGSLLAAGVSVALFGVAFIAGLVSPFAGDVPGLIAGIGAFAGLLAALVAYVFYIGAVVHLRSGLTRVLKRVEAAAR